jgi:hypothetical protein
MWSMPAVDARVNENGPSSRQLEVMDAQLSAVSTPAASELRAASDRGETLGNCGCR